MTGTRIVCFDGVGTDGRVPGSVLATTADHLAAKLDCPAEWVPWGGSTLLNLGGGGSWADNARAGVDELARRMRSHDDDIILLSFSGGSKPAHDFLAKHPEFHHRVLAAAFLSDPWRPRDRWQHGLPHPGGWGVCGERHTPIPGRAFWTTVPGDVIPNAPADSLLRHLADVSYGHPDRLIHDAIHIFDQGRFQLALHLGLPPHQWLLGLGRRIREASEAVGRYMGGWHTEHYHGPVDTGGGDTRSLAVRLADSMAWGLQRRGLP